MGGEQKGIDAAAMLDEITDIGTSKTRIDSSDIDELEKRAEKTAKVIAELEDVKKKVESAEGDEEYQIASKILSATLETLPQTIKNEKDDLARVVLSLDAEISGIDARFSGFSVFNAKEQALINEAEKALNDAREELGVAKQKWNIFGRRDRAVARAEENIKKSEINLEAKKQKAKELQRDRLMNASMEDSFQDIQVKTEKIMRILLERKESILTELQSVQEGKEIFQERQQKASELMEKLDQELETKRAQQEAETEKLEEFINGTPEHTAQETLISNLTAELEDLRGQRNKALIIFQESEKFIKRFEIDEKAHIALRDNIDMWHKTLKIGSEARLRTFASLLEAMKANADQIVAQKLDSIGVETDQKGAEMMAQIHGASDEARMQRMEKHPQLIKNMVAALEAQAQKQQEIFAREKDYIEEIKKKYGITSPKGSLFQESDAQ